jgi:hypothetical protein
MRISKTTRIAVIAVFVTMTALPLLIGAVIAVFRGKGMYGYENVYGLFMSSMSLVIFAGVFGLVFVVVMIARAVYYWRVRRGI